METIPRNNTEPDEDMRKRVRKAGVIGIGALASMGAIGAGQTATPERQSVPQENIVVSAEEVHSSRENEANKVLNQPATELNEHNEAEPQTLQNEPAAWWPVEVKQNWLTINSIAQEYMIDPYLVASIVTEESMGRNIKNEYGATGLMQIMPSTAQEIARLRHRSYYNMEDPQQNLDYGCWLIHYLDEKYIKARGISLNSDMGIAMLAVYYGDGEGAGELWARNDYNQNVLSEQAKHVAPMWTDMYHNRNKVTSEVFEQVRGK